MPNRHHPGPRRRRRRAQRRRRLGRDLARRRAVGRPGAGRQDRRLRRAQHRRRLHRLVLQGRVSTTWSTACRCSWGSGRGVLLRSGRRRRSHRRSCMAFHQAFLESAAQGISVFAASGDSGALRHQRRVQRSGRQRADASTSRHRIRRSPRPAARRRRSRSAAARGTPDLVVSHRAGLGLGLHRELPRRSTFGRRFQHALFPAGGGGGVSIVLGAAGVPAAHRRHPQDRGRTRASSSTTARAGQTCWICRRTSPAATCPTSRSTPIRSPATSSTRPRTAACSTASAARASSRRSSTASARCSRRRTHGRVGLWNPMLYRFKRLYGSGAVVAARRHHGGRQLVLHRRPRLRARRRPRRARRREAAQRRAARQPVQLITGAAASFRGSRQKTSQETRRPGD